MEFNEFKEAYIDDLSGYLPTYVTVDEEFEKDGFMRLQVELIAPFRMTDGPSRFFRVINVIVNREQYELMKHYISNAGDKWKMELVEKIEGSVKYNRSKF